MGKTYKDSNKEKNFTNKGKVKKSNTKSQKEKRPNKSFDYSSSDFD